MLIASIVIVLSAFAPCTCFEPTDDLNLLQVRLSVPVSSGWQTVTPASPGANPIHVFVGTDAGFAPKTPKDTGDLMHEFGQFHSQVGQDKTIAEIVYGGDANGSQRYYVDLAANDAVNISNTVSLDKDYGWKGLCIEPNQQYWDGLSRRGCDVAAAVIGGKASKAVDFVLAGSRFNVTDGVYGGIKGAEFDQHEGVSVKRDTIPIEELFAKFNVPDVIDYFSLDVEGAEELIMSAFPWKKYTIMALTVERPSEGLQASLEANGLVYLKDHGSFGDKFFLNQAIPNFEAIKNKVLSP